MKSWQLLLLGLLFGLAASGLVLLVAAPSGHTPLTVAQSTSNPAITVDVDGFVLHPGVYELTTGDRVNNAIQAAGGIIEGADTTAINLAAFVADGQKILVPGIDPSSSFASTGPSNTHLLNLNSATLDELIQLPGIGQQKAEAILLYRSTYGKFLAVEDLLYVPGIGQSLLDTIRNYVTVEK